VQSALLDMTSLPSGRDRCDLLPGPPLVTVELRRANIDRPGTFIERLFENSRDRWKLLEAEPGSRVLRRVEDPDHFRYSIAHSRGGVTSAIDVEREPGGVLWTHGHLAGARKLDCALHRYALSSASSPAELQVRVEIRSTSRVFRFYRHRMVRDAHRSANEQLDELLSEL
jgi:hypothetical protein